MIFIVYAKRIRQVSTELYAGTSAYKDNLSDISFIGIFKSAYEASECKRRNESYKDADEEIFIDEADCDFA